MGHIWNQSKSHWWAPTARMSHESLQMAHALHFYEVLQDLMDAEHHYWEQHEPIDVDGTFYNSEAMDHSFPSFLSPGDRDYVAPYPTLFMRMELNSEIHEIDALMDE